MVLVGIVARVHENEVRPDPVEDFFNLDDECSTIRQVGIMITAPEELLSAQQMRGLLLLLASLRRIPTPASVSHDEDVDLVSLEAVLDQRAAAADFDVIRMGADRQDLQRLSSLVVWFEDCHRRS